MKKFTITWNIFPYGEFPKEEISHLDLGVEVYNTGILQQTVAIFSLNEEELTPDIIFNLGVLIQAISARNNRL